MDIYYIETSKRKGYTFEKPHIDFFIDNNEFLFNRYQFDKSVFHYESSDIIPNYHIYKVFYTRNSRGDIHESDVNYFTNQDDATIYYNSVNTKYINKMISPYEILECKVYDTVANIPILSIEPIAINEMSLLLQKKQYTDYRLNYELSFEEKIKILENERITMSK
jgi:hypothetical protein